MERYALGLAYDGTRYHGWQRQRDLPTIQADIEAAVSRIADEPVSVVASGRTDRGVHATAQVCAFSTHTHRPIHDWLRGLNALTQPELAVHWVRPVAADFHPRYGAVSRTYTYVWIDATQPQPFALNRAWQTASRLDADAMHRAAQALLGEHDFSALRGAGCQSLSPVRRVDQCTVVRQGDSVVLTIRANAFLLHMVRNIARLLHDVGGQPDAIDVPVLLAGRDRTRLGATAPAHGLYFTAADFPEANFPLAEAPRLVLAGIPANQLATDLSSTERCR